MVNKKNSNLIIIILIVLVIGLVGFICYDKLLNNKDNNNIENKDEQNKIENKDEQNNTQLTYSEFATKRINLLKQMASWQDEKDNIIVLSDFYSTDSYYFRAELSNDLELSIRYFSNNNGFSLKKIANNVIDFKFVNSGPDEKKMLCFIYNDGTIGYASFSNFFNEEPDEIKVTEKVEGFSDIVSIESVAHDLGGTTIYPEFVDINNILHKANFIVWP